MCTNKRFRKYPTYKLHGHTLEALESAKYLGVTISEDLSWTPHVDNTASKALKTLGFLRRNMYHCTNRVRERTYNILVLPVINYAAAAWDPYLEKDMKCPDHSTKYIWNINACTFLKFHCQNAVATDKKKQKKKKKKKHFIATYNKCSFNRYKSQLSLVTPPTHTHTHFLFAQCKETC